MSEQGTVIEPYRRVGCQEVPVFSPRIKRRWNLLRGELWNRETLLVLPALVLLARLRLLGELAPFGLAFFAVASKGESKRMALYGAVAVLAAASTGKNEYTLSLLLAVLIFCLLQEKIAVRKVPLSLLAGLSMLAGSLPRVWFSYFHTYDLVLLLLETVLAALAVSVFARVFSRPLSQLSADRHVEAVTSWVIFLGLILLSLIQGGFFLPLLAGAVARLVVLWMSFMFGAGMAAAAGAMLGFLLGIQGNALIWLSILTFAGFLSGLFRPFGRLAVSLGFFSGALALSLYLTGWEAVPVEAGITTAAIVFFLLGPVLPNRIRVLAPFFAVSGVDEAKRVRDLTAVRIKDYARVFRELSLAFEQAVPLEEDKGPALTALVEALAERVCKYCASRRRCFEKDLQRTYNAMLRVIADLDNGQSVRDIKTPEFFQKYCRRKDDFLKTLSFLKELENVNVRWQKRLQENRELVSLQLSGLSGILFDLAKEVRDQRLDTGKAINDRYFHVEIGVAQAAKGHEEVCGDYYSYLELRDGRQAFILSDGMGNGSKAYLESRSTVQLVEQLLLAGFQREPVIRTVNTILQLRSSEESFATLDVLLINPVKSEAEFLKTGAAPSYYCTRDKVKEIRTPSLPLGILNEVEMKQVSIGLEEDALIIMVTDGIFDVNPAKPDWLKKYLMGKLPDHPQVLADEIIHRAKTENGQRMLRDDITVLVCRARRLKHRVKNYITS